MRLSNEVVLITGAGSGIGRAGAIRFAEEGACVAAVDLDGAAAAATVRQVESGGGTAIAVGADSSSDSQIVRAVEGTVNTFGKLTVLWANSGVGAMPSPVAEATVETFEKVHSVNAKGPWLAARAAVPAIRQAGGGSIVFTSSLSGLKGRPDNSVYSSSKGAVTMLTRALAVELAPLIRVNSVAPVATETPMLSQFVRGDSDLSDVRRTMIAQIPLNRLATPLDIANAALFLTSSEAAMITGVNLPVDGGAFAGALA